MSEPRVQVSFKVSLGDDVWTDEGAVRERLEEVRAVMRAREDLDGAIVIRGPGQPEVDVEDPVVHLTLNVCFRAVVELAEDRHVVIPHFEWDGYFRLDPEGWYVRLSGDDVPTARVYRNDLLKGLVACGERVIDLLGELGGTEGWMSLLEPKAAEARRALASAPKAWPGVDPASLER